MWAYIEIDMAYMNFCASSILKAQRHNQTTNDRIEIEEQTFKSIQECNESVQNKNNIVFIWS